MAPWEGIRKTQDQHQISRKPTVAKATVGFLLCDKKTQPKKDKKMSARYADVAFDPEDEFNLPLRFEREALAEKFAELKDELLDFYIADSESLPLQARLKHAANEAAGLAWTTEFPLLVFPALFDEFARRERARAGRQERIIAKTEDLLESIA